jgi:hypothetical protein
VLLVGGGAAAAWKLGYLKIPALDGADQANADVTKARGEATAARAEAAKAQGDLNKTQAELKKKKGDLEQADKEIKRLTGQGGNANALFTKLENRLKGVNYVNNNQPDLDKGLQKLIKDFTAAGEHVGKKDDLPEVAGAVKALKDTLAAATKARDDVVDALAKDDPLTREDLRNKDLAQAIKALGEDRNAAWKALDAVAQGMGKEDPLKKELDGKKFDQAVKALGGDRNGARKALDAAVAKMDENDDPLKAEFKDLALARGVEKLGADRNDLRSKVTTGLKSKEFLTKKKPATADISAALDQALKLAAKAMMALDQANRDVKEVQEEARKAREEAAKSRGELTRTRRDLARIKDELNRARGKRAEIKDGGSKAAVLLAKLKKRLKAARYVADDQPDPDRGLQQLIADFTATGSQVGSKGDLKGVKEKVKEVADAKAAADRAVDAVVKDMGDDDPFKKEFDRKPNLDRAIALLGKDRNTVRRALDAAVKNRGKQVPRKKEVGKKQFDEKDTPRRGKHLTSIKAYAREYDALRRAGRPTPAKLESMIEKVTAALNESALKGPERGALLVLRSRVQLDLAKRKKPLRPNNPRVKDSKKDAAAALQDAPAEAHYALGQVAEALGQRDQALKEYDLAIKNHKGKKIDLVRYKNARARVLGNKSMKPARPARKETGQSKRGKKRAPRHIVSGRTPSPAGLSGRGRTTTSLNLPQGAARE